MGARVRSHFNVNPRYTAGSPAMVDEATAVKVAEEERHFIEHALSGAWGAEEKTRAKNQGLGPIKDKWGTERSIAEEVTEHSDHWMVRDLVTGVIYQRRYDGKPMAKIARRCSRCVAAQEDAIAKARGDA